MRPTLDEARYVKALEVIEEELGSEKKDELKKEIEERAEEYRSR